MNIVFLDVDTLGPEDLSFERFDASWQITRYASTAPHELAGRLTGMQVAVTNKVPFRADVLACEEAADLKLIAVAATGVDHIDIPTAEARGIAVANVPCYAADAVAQHTFALLLELAACAGRYAADVETGAWEKSSTFCLLSRPTTELAGKTLGIIGYGEIGRVVHRIAEAFGMPVLVAARKGAEVPTGHMVPSRVALDELLRRSDVVTLHCPLTSETKNLLDKKALALMKPSAFLINTGRGGLVDESALIEALQNGKLAGAGFDVITKEPPPPDHPMLVAARQLDHLIITPHTAWSAREARQRLLDTVAKNISAWT